MKPPFPAVKGLYGYPTVVNNVETICAVPWIISHGGAEYAGIGLGKSTGTKLISSCGNINRPGVYEIELGLPVEEFIYSGEWCGGISKGTKTEGSNTGRIIRSHFAGPSDPENSRRKAKADEL